MLLTRTLNILILLLIISIIVLYILNNLNNLINKNNSNNKYQTLELFNDRQMNNKGLGLVNCRKYPYLCVKEQNKKRKLKYGFEPYLYATRKGIEDLEKLRK